MELFIILSLAAWIVVVGVDTRRKRRNFLRDHK